MNMVRLLYVSHLAKDCGPDDLAKILEVSRKNNQKTGVTGALCYSANGFLQCIEGPPEAVNDLYRHIARDDRHVDVTLLDYSDVNDRAFGKWSMAYIREDEIDGSILEQIRGTTTFDPFDLAPGEAFDFLKRVTQERTVFLGRQQAAAENAEG